MKTTTNSVCLMLLVVCITILVGCNGSTSGKQSAAVSDCNPNMNEIIGVDDSYQSSAAINKLQQAIDDATSDMYSHILSVRCINDNKMLIVHYDPEYVCCLTPHSTCERNGNKIVINDWDTGSNPCACNCPRKTDVTLSDVPYGEYAFSIRYANKEKHTATIDFSATTDTIIVFER